LTIIFEIDRDFSPKRFTSRDKETGAMAKMTIHDFRARPFNSVMQAATQATLTHGVFISLFSLGVQSPPELADSPLLGIPFAVKDNIDVLGLPTTGGTELLRSSFPSVTATVVSRITGAGAVVVGKTNLHELAFGITSNNGSFGPVRNPHDTERSAGGSSGGSAVAVALGIVPFALGTDTGGSMQIPAAHCGIVGMRPSTGRYPADGVLRLSPTRDTIGVMASTVSDVAFIDGIITGEGELPATDLATVRLGVPASGFLPGVDARIRNRFDALRHSLEEAGVTMVEFDSDPIHALAARCGGPITFYESEREIVAYLSSLPRPYSRSTFTNIRDASLSPDVRKILDHIIEMPVTEAQYDLALQQRADLQALFSDLLAHKNLNALFYPTVPILAPPLGDDDTTLLNGDPVPVFETSIRHTGPGSIAGLPAISIPGGRIAGLPFGVTLESEPGSDRRLLSLASEIFSLLSKLH
jgi:Asp-tRNA(Asn)/Glu-tRNA(Gln) amidotransferase A subunit family amidase